jgi:hypothetical protein
VNLPSLRHALYSVALLLCSPVGALAANAPATFIVGVGTHLFNRPMPVTVPVAMMREAGIGSVRDDVFWSTIEQQPGVLGMPQDAFRYLKAQRASGLGNVLVLGYGNRFHANDSKPIARTVRDGYARFVDVVAHRLKGQVGFYEVYNEWDLEDPASPAFSDAYLDLVRDTAAQLHGIDPKARVLAGAVTTQGIKAGFADRLVAGGVMKSVDGLSLHPYVHCEKTSGGNTPESWVRWLREVSAHLEGIAGQPVPLYLTEMAWHSTADRHPCGIDEGTQAAWLARAYLLAKTLPSIKGLWWYDLANDGNDPADPEHNFGLLRRDLSPKPAYEALKRLAPVLADYHYVPGPVLPAAAGGDDLVQLAFQKGNERLLAVWTQGAAASIVLTVPGAPQGPVPVSGMPLLVPLNSIGKP